MRILLDALRAEPTVEVRFGHRVTGVKVAGPHVTVSTSDGDYTGALLVGADGARSTVRDGLGVEFEGMTYEHRYLLLGIDAPLEEYFPGISSVNYVSDPVEHLMLLRIPDCWRVMFEVTGGPPDEVVRGDAFIHDRLAALLAPRPMPAVLSRQVYRVHQRVAKEFRRGPVVLVGDAAHVNSPIGGMGLNSGIHDAYTLGQGLSDLDTWAERRRTVALRDIRRITHRNTRDLSMSDGDARTAELREIARDPARARTWMLEASMIASARAQKLVTTHGRTSTLP